MKKTGGIAISFDEDLEVFDLVLENGDLKGDSDLATLVLIGILTDRRSFPDDPIPNARGWTGDGLRKATESLIGSRLFLIRNEKTTDTTLVKINEYVKESLQLLIDDGIAATVEVISEYFDKVKGIIAIQVTITKPFGELDTKFEILWNQLESN